MPKLIVHKSQYEQLKSQFFGSEKIDKKILTSEEAKRMKDKFNSHHRAFRIAKTNVDRFIAELVRMSDNSMPDGHEVGIRYYMGKENAVGDFNVVMVPCHAKKDINGSDDHLEDKEKSWLSLSGNKFIAIMHNGNISVNATACRALVATYDYKKEKRAVYHPLSILIKFIGGLKSAEHNYKWLSVTMARDADGLLSIVQECLDSAGSVIESEVDFDAKTKLLATGTAFDEGDLIPPPPPKSTGVTSTDDPWIPDSIFDSTP